jgi:N-methylhydantoinase A/oxoprolinase/acetone carboxylase beta subunit
LAGALDDLGREAAALVGGSPLVTTTVDCRYRGQSHELTVPTPAHFHAEHRRRNGYSRPEAPVEVVALRARAVRDPVIDYDDLPAPERCGGTGPAVIVEDDCTIWLPDGWRAEPADGGALVLRRAR